MGADKTWKGLVKEREGKRSRIGTLQGFVLCRSLCLQAPWHGSAWTRARECMQEF